MGGQIGVDRGIEGKQVCCVLVSLARCVISCSATFDVQCSRYTEKVILDIDIIEGFLVIM